METYDSYIDEKLSPKSVKSETIEIRNQNHYSTHFDNKTNRIDLIYERASLVN